MSLSAAEQYMLELMNRARLDPAAEAARAGVDLNLGLKVGQIDTSSRQVLAANDLLDTASTGHSAWMLAADQLSHVGAGGSTIAQRLVAAGYSATVFGENLAIKQILPGVTEQALVEAMTRDMFVNAGQRLAWMNDKFTEVGATMTDGTFTQSGTDFHVEVQAVNFASAGSTHFLTGVAYADANKDKFYSMGEGSGGVVFTVGTKSAATASAGGYSLGLGSETAVAVTGHVGTKAFALTVDMSPGNVKLDLVSGTTFYTSGSVVLGSGVNNVVMLGLDGLSATGNFAANAITGNSGANTLSGFGGNDNLMGNGGADTVNGGAGNDRISGGKGADVLTGGQGIDSFVFNAGDGNDRVLDFSVATGDKLVLDHALWAGQTLKPAGVMFQFADKVAGEVVLDFGNGDVIHLVGLTTVANLGTMIEIF